MFTSTTQRLLCGWFLCFLKTSQSLICLHFCSVAFEYIYLGKIHTMQDTSLGFSWIFFFNPRADTSSGCSSWCCFSSDFSSLGPHYFRPFVGVISYFFLDLSLKEVQVQRSTVRCRYSFSPSVFRLPRKSKTIVWNGPMGVFETWTWT